MSDKKNVTVKIDGHKPVICMTDKERDKFYLQTYGMTFEEFHKKYPPEELDLSKAKFLE